MAWFLLVLALNPAPTFESLADDAWLIHVGQTADPVSNSRVHALSARIRTASPDWLRDLTPAYASLGVYFDATRIDSDRVRDWLQAQCRDANESTTVQTSRLIEIPVRYGDRFGEDILGAAAELGLSSTELIARHSASLYTVAMIGFAPGFPYLSGLDPALALPRLATPRTRVPVGSVGIGGSQTGIYPRDSPGGWRLIGRTPLTLFDPQRAEPSLLAPGDRVRFVAIDEATFARLAAST